MDIVDRIQTLVSEKGISVAALERNTGLSNGIVKKWKKQSPSCDKIIAIANYLNTSIEYLILGLQTTRELDSDSQQLLNYYNQLNEKEKGIVLGKAETLAELASEREAKEQVAEQSQKAVEIPLVAADERPDPGDQEPEDEEYYIDFYDFPASAGTGLLIGETVAEKLKVKASSEALSADYAIPISGDSMEPSFSNEDIVLIKSCQKISEGEIGIFVLDGDVYIKEYGGDRLISHNAEYSPIMLKGYRGAVCLGRVLGKAEVMD